MSTKAPPHRPRRQRTHAPVPPPVHRPAAVTSVEPAAARDQSGRGRWTQAASCPTRQGPARPATGGGIRSVVRPLVCRSLASGPRWRRLPCSARRYTSPGGVDCARAARPVQVRASVVSVRTCATPACLSYDTTTPDGNGTLCTRTARNPDLAHQRPEELRAGPPSDADRPAAPPPLACRQTARRHAVALHGPTSVGESRCCPLRVSGAVHVPGPAHRPVQRLQAAVRAPSTWPPRGSATAGRADAGRATPRPARPMPLPALCCPPICLPHTAGADAQDAPRVMYRPPRQRPVPRGAGLV